MVTVRYKADLSKLNPRQLDAYNRQICVVCLKNKGRVADNLFCDTCNALTAAEKTREDFGGPKERNSNQHLKNVAIKTTLALIYKGFSHKQIAETMGLSRRSLTIRMNRWRRQGYDIPLMYNAGRAPIPYDPKPNPGTKVNPHGGGLWGIKGCFCEPCVLRRRESKREYEKKRRLERKKEAEAG